MNPVLLLGISILLAAAPCQAGTLVMLVGSRLLVARDNGAAKVVPFLRSPSGVGTPAINDPAHILWLDRGPQSRAMDPDRLQVFDLGTGRISQQPLPHRRVRQNRILRLLRMLPQRRGLAYRWMDRYKSSLFTFIGKTRTIPRTFRNLRSTVSSVQVMPNGRFIVVTQPGFNRKSERRRRVKPFLRYLRGLPQRLFFGNAWGGPLHMRLERPSFEWIRLVDQGRRAVYLLPAGARAHERSYELRSFDFTTNQETVMGKITVPSLRGHYAPPVLHTSIAGPWVVRFEGMHYTLYEAGKRGSRKLALPEGERLVEPLDCLVGQHTSLTPYWITIRWLGKVGPRRFRYAVHVIRIEDAKTVFSTTHVGISPARASYLP